MYTYEETIAKDKDTGLLRPIFKQMISLRKGSRSLILPLFAYIYVPFVAFGAILIDRLPNLQQLILLWLIVLAIILSVILKIWVGYTAAQNKNISRSPS